MELRFRIKDLTSATSRISLFSIFNCFSRILWKYRETSPLKSARFNFEYRKNASKGHRFIGELLRNSSYFKDYEIYQEYHVSKVNPTYSNNREKFDWAIPQLKLVIEFHGVQHSRIQSFGKEDALVTIEKFRAQKIRDQNKEQAAKDMGWVYLSFNDRTSKNLTDKMLLNLYSNLASTAVNINKIADTLKAERRGKFPVKSGYFSAMKTSEEYKEKQKAYRKAQYQKRKQWYKDKCSDKE